MELYAVAFDSYNDGWGAEINLFGVYETRERAVQRVEQLRKSRKEDNLYVPDENRRCIRRIVLNEDCDIYLGGYIE